MSKNPKVCIIGSEGWGSAIATAVCQNVLHYDFDPQVNIYVYDEIVRNNYLSQVMNERHENIKYLPGIMLPKNLVAVNDLIDAARDADILIFATPHTFLKAYCNILADHVKTGAYAVSLIKGLEHIKDGEIDLYSHAITKHLGIPCYSMMNANSAMEMAQGKLCEITIGCNNQDHANELTNLLQTENCMVFAIDDVDGVELCNSLKDLVALSAGFIDGLRLGENARVACLHLGLKEMMRFIKNFNPTTKVSTLFESCGLANSVASSYGDKNVTFAKNLVISRKTIPEIEANLLSGRKLLGPIIAEEVYAYLEKSNLHETYPLFSTVHRICQREVSPYEIVETLRNHPDLSNYSITNLQKDEFSMFSSNTDSVLENIADTVPDFSTDSAESSRGVEELNDEPIFNSTSDDGFWKPYFDYFNDQSNSRELKHVARNSNTAAETCASDFDKGSMEFSFEMGAKKDDPEICLQIKDTSVPKKDLLLIGSQYTANQNPSDSKSSSPGKQTQINPIVMSDENTTPDNPMPMQYQGRPRIDKYEELKVRVKGKENPPPETQTVAQSKPIDERFGENIGDRATRKSTALRKSKSTDNNKKVPNENSYEMRLFKDDPQQEKFLEMMRKREKDELELKLLKRSTIKSQLTREYLEKPKKNIAKEKHASLGKDLPTKNTDNKPSNSDGGFKYDYKISIRSKKVPIDPSKESNPSNSTKAELNAQDNYNQNIPEKWEQLSLNKGKLEVQEKLPKSMLLKPITFKIKPIESKTNNKIEMRKSDNVASTDSSFLAPGYYNELASSNLTVQSKIANESQEMYKSVPMEPIGANQQSGYFDEQNNSFSSNQSNEKGNYVSSLSPRFSVEDIQHLKAMEDYEKMEKCGNKAIGGDASKQNLENTIEMKAKGTSDWNQQQQHDDKTMDKNTRWIRFNYDEARRVWQPERKNNQLVQDLEAEVENTILDTEIPKEIESRDRSINNNENPKEETTQKVRQRIEQTLERARQDDVERNSISTKKSEKVNIQDAEDILDEHELKESDEIKKYGQYLQFRLKEQPILDRSKVDEDTNFMAINQSESMRPKYGENNALPDSQEKNNSHKDSTNFLKQTVPSDAEKTSRKSWQLLPFSESREKDETKNLQNVDTKFRTAQTFPLDIEPADTQVGRKDVENVPSMKGRQTTGIDRNTEDTGKVRGKAGKHTSEWDWLLDSEKFDNSLKQEKNLQTFDAYKYRHLVDFIAGEDRKENKRQQKEKELERQHKLRYKINKSSQLPVEGTRAQFNEVMPEDESTDQPRLMDGQECNMPISTSVLKAKSSAERPTEFDNPTQAKGRTSKLSSTQPTETPRREWRQKRISLAKSKTPTQHEDLSRSAKQSNINETETEPNQTKLKRMETQISKISKRLAKIMTKGQPGQEKYKERPVAYEGNDPYNIEEGNGRTKPFPGQIREQQQGRVNRKVSIKPFHPPLNPRVRIPRPPFDVRDQEYHTISYRRQTELQRNSILPQMPLSVASQSMHASASVPKLTRPVLKLPPFMMRSSVLAIELGFFAAFLSRYRGGCK
ncbi:uncharacterized protein LOC6574672 [Drosophila mojavensis]|uniref:Glycerol-3-phosphate dehydrogenase [NAD(+)] n=1 Tax=Drosophila mojavensis TaxID=7230 RepID=B4K5D8_DROMO|nr:uncharacterized protein LOC6574672 [Drosophila mojavensis]EDW16164.2 uncharacterized protein Dmoj_GI22380 [Drosophila mojavensis]